ncbi:cobalamin B12-binding domain-containing protein [Bradyrhizobium ontarionense]|uniref:Cobalamin B12-binding domain-containing protein n=1 Tax=Bradyrhizobium ontarionense TaxID=2898149 RepID=A0ABY3RLH4_9BRAD|nr:cobalamin B12-binding domain-containing protein [Bradyrhizobium sp. A19]UFZ07691.1 cobalamin B12-binding domain-containing protein [Bradyrhizobium sp. A19]
MRNARHPELNATIEAEIIPRLVMAHAPALERMPAIIAATEQEAADFAELVLGADDDRAVACIQAHRDHGETLERIYLELLVPTANHLRHLWADDERDFADVTLALWRLQQLLRHFSPAFCAELAAVPTGLRGLLTTAPGDRREMGHMMFGLVLAGEFFRRDGWDTWIEPDTADRGFLHALRTQWFNVVEFFANSDKKLDDLASNIRMARRESSNQDIGVLVCGPAFTERPELVLLVGGDGVVSDPSREASQARHVVSLLTERR